MPDKFVISIVEPLEDHRISSFIRMTLESVPSEGLLYDSPVRIETTLLGDAQHGAELRELPLRENLVFSSVHVEVRL